MNDTFKNWIAQGGAWTAVLMGGLSFELWLGLAGLGISLFMAMTNWRHKQFERRLAEAEHTQRVEMHALQMARLRADLAGRQGT